MKPLKLISVFVLCLIPSGSLTKLGGFKVFYEATTQFYSLSGPQLKALGQILTKRMQFLLLITGSSITSLSIYLTVIIRL